MIGATLPVDVLGNSALPIYQTENVVTLKSFTKVVRYQKAKQLVTTNPLFDFDFNNYLSQDNSAFNNQFKYTIQQDLPSTIDFKSKKIITAKNADNLNEL